MSQPSLRCLACIALPPYLGYIFTGNLLIPSHCTAENRMKSIYFHLSSGHHQRASAALALLAAVAGRGTAIAADLTRAFDFDQKALIKLARPPKCVADFK